MTDGLDASLVLSGTTLVAVGGLAVKIWLASRGQRITPQPLEVREAKAVVTADVFRDYRAEDQASHSNLFARVSHCEQRIAAVEAGLQSIQTTVGRMDGKLDTIIGRLK